MPIYEYSCKKCGQTIEVMQKMSDPELKRHKGCGGTLTKLISASGFQFKGTGWYVTDYARKSQDSSEGSKGDSKTSDKTGDKPADKTSAPAAGGDTKPAETKPKEAKPSRSSDKKD